MAGALLLFGCVAGVLCTHAIMLSIQEEAEVVQLAQVGGWSTCKGSGLWVRMVAGSGVQPSVTATLLTAGLTPIHVSTAGAGP